jgi:hypothetical protein
MIALAVLLSLAASADPSPAQPEEVTVMARRLKDWRGTVTKKGDGLVCETKASTGDAAIDDVGCKTMVNCLLAEREALKLPVKDRTPEWHKAMNGKLSGCMDAEHARLLSELADARAAKAAGVP